ncbi:hypothetical protein GMORB2_0187 [Geosmithia morbida]|uniref:Myb-like domain-containing protein n=1 Tax=Geosmithia morbida TaxID=1094350 RepID=A0A9P5D7B1_9HYPO|nr:uncharacterized protein GMORB2_0187 [Geosmithia morbida]KAF4126451.1 hypothetical protein GMORB2_0187 [Geosmithia morbida]
MNNKNWNDRADKDLFFTILSVKNIGVISGSEWVTIGNYMRRMGYGFTNEGCRQHFQGLRRAQNKAEQDEDGNETAKKVDPTLNPITRRPGPGRGRPRKSTGSEVSPSIQTITSGLQVVTAIPGTTDSLSPSTQLTAAASTPGHQHQQHQQHQPPPTPQDIGIDPHEQHQQLPPQYNVHSTPRFHHQHPQLESHNTHYSPQPPPGQPLQHFQSPQSTPQQHQQHQQQQHVFHHSPDSAAEQQHRRDSSTQHLSPGQQPPDAETAAAAAVAAAVVSSHEPTPVNDSVAPEPLNLEEEDGEGEEEDPEGPPAKRQRLDEAEFGQHDPLEDDPVLALANANNGTGGPESYHAEFDYAEA